MFDFLYKIRNYFVLRKKSEQIENNKLKKINIQNLARKKQYELENKSKINNIYRINNNILYDKLQKNPKEIYYYEDNSLNKNKSFNLSNNDFFGSFLAAYNLHGDIILVPDDIWIQISLFFSKYINSGNNAEILRKKLVNHENKIELIVKEYPSNQIEAIEMEYKWDYFFSEIIKQIELHTLDGIVNGFQCDFTTTTDLYKVVSTAIIMNSFKKFFTYGRFICGCGINNVYFRGIKEDWIKIFKKLDFLSNFDSGDNILTKYIDKIKIIINKFIETYDDNIDVDFWNKIITIDEKQRKSSGGDSYKETWTDGWLLHFFGIYKKTQIETIPNYLINVPIKLVNEFTNIEKDLILGGGWVSISKFDDYTYKPNLGLSIINKTMFKNDDR
jgi:hypothetical protein